MNGSYGESNSGRLYVKAGNFFNNTGGIGIELTNKSTAIISGGLIYKNDNGIKIRGNSICTLENGEIYSNNIGIYNEGTLTITGGTIKNNMAENGASIYQNGICTILGGSFSNDISQDVYLVDDDKYVLTNNNYTSFVVKPNDYKRGRILIKTTGNVYANEEMNNYVRLYPKNKWGMRVLENSSDIVLWDKIQVKVRYIDKYTSDILSSYTIENYENTNYTTSPKNIEGYTLVQDSENTSGVIENDDIEVNYYYALNNSVEVNYIDNATKEILDSYTINGNQGMNYETEEKHFDNYELVEIPNNKAGVIERDKIIVNYCYKYKTSLKVKYVDSYTNEVLDTVVIDGYEGDTIQTNFKNIEGYNLFEKPGTETYTLRKQNEDVIYKCVHISEGVIIQYVDIITGELLTDSIYIKGNQGDSYNSEVLSFEGFELVEMPKNLSGSMDISLIEVKYYYKYKTKINVKYVDLYKNDVVYAEEIGGYEGDKYSVKVKEIENYKLDKEKLPKNNTGIIKKENEDVVYYVIAVSKGIEIKYIDKATDNNICDSEVIAGYEGDSFEIKPKKIQGYTLVQIGGNNNKGSLTKEKQEFIYYYLADCKVKVNYIDSVTNGKIKEVTLKGLETENYKAECLLIDEYDLFEEPRNSVGKFSKDEITINYYYKHKSSLTINYVSEDGTILDKIVSDGYEGDVIKISPKDIPYYRLIKSPDVQECTLTKNKDTITYIYNPLKFNIATKQELSNIKLNGVDIGKIKKIEINSKTKLNSLEVTFLITVLNNGEIDGSTMIYNYIPNGFTIKKEDNLEWGNIAYIKVDNLKAGETRTYSITYNSENPSVFGIITNKVEALNSVCEAGFKENTLGDNKSEYSFIISVVTGINIDLQIILVIILIVFAIILYIVKAKFYNKI